MVKTTLLLAGLTIYTNLDELQPRYHYSELLNTK